MTLNNLVSFSLAKLLREKGFDSEDCIAYYHLNVGYTKGYSLCYSDLYNQSEYATLAPTIGQVVDWLYEKHGIWIGVELTDNTLSFYFQPTIWTTKDRDYHDEDMIDQAKRICKWKEWQFNSRTEAYEFAINYCLTKLT